MTLRRDAQEVLKRYKAGLFRMMRDRRLLSRIFLPHLTGVVSFLALFFLGWFFKEPLRHALFGPTPFPLLFQFGAVVLFAIFGALIILFIALDFAARAILLDEMSRHGLSIAAEVGWARSTARELAEAVLRLVILVVIGVVFLLALMIPGLNILAGALFSLYLGADIVALSLSYLHMPLSVRIEVIRRHLSEVFFIGAVLAVALSIPFIGIIVLPLASLVAAELICSWIEQDEGMFDEYVTVLSSEDGVKRLP